MLDQLSLIQKIIVCVPPIILAVTLHEVAHGWMAKINGDRTAEMLGRLTLNPIKHIDPIGTVLLPAFLLFAGGFVFGWAKPVPIAFNQLSNPRQDMAKVALAGPGANFLMMLTWGVIMKLMMLLPESLQWLSLPMIYMSCIGIYINCVLMVLNLVPIPPLDGSRILSSFLPGPWAYKFSLIEPYGLFIVLALLFFGILATILVPIISTVVDVFANFTGVDIERLVTHLFK